MVKPIIEYTAVVWAPHTKRDIDMMREHNDKQLDLLPTTTPVTLVSRKCLQNLIALHLHDARDEMKAKMMFKIINHLVDIPANPFLTSISTVHITRS